MKTIDTLMERDWTLTLLPFGLAYGFFGKVFYESPQADFVGRLVSEDLFGEWPIENKSADTQTGLSLLNNFSAQWNAGMLDALQSDYMRLFIGPAQPFAPPWESFYVSRDHLLFQEQTLAVRSDYLRFGLQAPRLNSEPDDHLGLEFAFMLHLCTLGQSALESGDGRALAETIEAQRCFLSTHLLRWAPTCLQQVIDKAATGYYKGAAFLARGCLLEAAKAFEVPIPFAELAL